MSSGETKADTRAIQTAGSTTEIERKYVAGVFDSFDEKKTGKMDANELPQLCMALGIKPWHLVRYVKTTAGDGQEVSVTKGAVLDYWFDPNRPRPAPKKTKKVRKATKADVIKGFTGLKKSFLVLQKMVISTV